MPRRGGIKLLTLVRKSTKLAEVPAIIWTVLHPEQLIQLLPPNAVFLSKEAPFSHLVTVIRSALICMGNTPLMRSSTRGELIDATELKPSIFGISFDLKKFWAALRGHSH